MNTEIVDESGKLLNLNVVKRPLCLLDGHDVDKETVYKSGFGCVIDLYLRCDTCGKKFPVKPEFEQRSYMEIMKEA